MALQSDQNSFEAVALPHLDAAYNLARWLMRNAADAEDVVQEAMLRALTYFSSFRGVNPRGWLLQIVRNTAYASRKLDRGMIPVPLADEADGELSGGVEIADPGDDPEVALIRKSDRRQVDRLLAALPVDLREVLVLREIEELSYKEIAQITEAPIGTVMSRLWRARRLLAASASVEGSAA
jgi:RNA polymerase sigma-70 factor (ECF subfamily)